MLEKIDQGVTLTSQDLARIVSMESDLIGRDIEISESGHTWRGPIKGIEIDDGMFVVMLSWSAEHTYEAGGTWTYMEPSLSALEPNRIAVALSHGSAHDNDDGSIRLSAPMVWSATIMSAETKNLDPTDVRGFDFAIL